MKTQMFDYLTRIVSSTCCRRPVMDPIRRAGAVTVAGLLLVAGAAVSRAASGVWTNDASGIWSATANWLNGVVASGSASFADFTLDNVNTNTVTLDTSRTLGSLLFGASGGAATNDWMLNAANNSVLTLAGGTPTVAVSNGVAPNTAILALPVAGTSGLTKVGDGTLVLAGANSYSGATTVSGGTLRLTNTVAGVSAMDPLVYFSFDNVAGATVINQGTGGHAMDGVLVGGAAIVSGGHYGNALAIPAGASSASGSYVLVNNPVVNLNVSAPNNNWTVAMWLKTATVGAAYFYQGFGGWGSGNTEFYLESGVAGDPGQGSFPGGVRWGQGWESGTTSVTDDAWHFVVMTCTNGVKTIYVDGAVDPFTSGVNQWGGAGTGNQIRIGGTAGGADSQVGLGGMIDEFYMYNRALSQTEVQNLMSTSSGPMDVASALPDNSSVSLASGSVLDLNSATPVIASLAGLGTVDNLSSGAANLEMNITADTSLNTPLINSAGALMLTKMGSAKLTIPGVQTYTGGTVVNNGTLNITGSLEPSDGGGSSSGMVVRSGAVNFSGAFLTNYNYTIGTTTNLTGALYQTAGVLKQSQGGSGSDFQIGGSAFGYGYYYNAPGATAFVNEIGLAGEGNPSGNGQMDVYGSIFDSGWFVVARGSSGQTAGFPSTGILNIWPGSTLTYAGGGIVCNWGAGGSQLTVINMMGGVVTNTSANVPINLNQSGNAANAGILNLNGGSITAGWVTGGANGTRVNFNGGTLAAVENQGSMMGGLAAATVYGGGGTFNNNGFNVTIGQQLNAPAGSGEQGISSFTGGAGYIAPPIVTVVNDPSDTTGVGATAIAQIDPATGSVTNVMITCPGVNYTATPTFVLSGGNPTTPATITGAAPTANTSGGMTFLGSGSVTLNGGYTYTGPTVVAGGTLNLISSAVTPSTAGNLVLSNATLGVVFSNSVTLPVGNLVMQTGATINIAYGTVFANPTVAAITASGSITAAPTNVINVSGIGLKSGLVHLIAHGGGALSSADFANFGLTLPPGVSGTLVNNSSSIDLNITSAPKQLTWQGENGSDWDTSTINWTNNANGTSAAYTQYSASAGDGVTFNDTVYNDGVNPPATNINLTAAYTPFPVTVDSTLPYSISGAGSIGGVGNLVKNNTGSLTLLTANTFSGGVAVNGGTLIITNDSALGANASVLTLNGSTLQVNGNTTNNSRVLTVPATATVGVGSNDVARFGGGISGAGGLTKTDSGTLVLAGNNTLGGVVTVNQGTLASAGNATLPSVPIVGSTSGANAVLNIVGGTFTAANNAGQFTSSIIAGSAAGSVGSIVLNGGTLANQQQFGLGAGAGGYGNLTMTGGTLQVGSYFVVGFNNDVAVFSQSGGICYINTNCMTIAAGGTGAKGEADFSGGTFISTNSATGDPYGGRGGIFVGENGHGVMNVSGSANVVVSGEAHLLLGRNGGASGTVNLDGGTVSASQVTMGGGSGILNFNGGTLKANASSSSFLSGLNSVNIYNGGAIIDDGGNNITISQPLLGVTNGYGVTSIPLSDGGSGYVAPPQVTVVDDNSYGSNAMAVAQVDPASGTVTKILITCPGSGFDTLGSIPDIQVTGGGGSTIPPTVNAGAATFVQNGVGGLTKEGSGTVTLTGVNTFTGPITNNAGTLVLNSASTYPGSVHVNAGTLSMTTATTFTGPTTVSNSATFTVTQTGTNASTGIGALTFDGGASGLGATLGLGLIGLDPTVPVVNCGTLTFNGTNSISVAGAVKVGAIALVHYTGAIAGPGTYTNLNLPQGVQGYISNYVAGSTLFAIITSTGPGLVWSGTNSNPALTNLWDIGSTTNWLLGSTPTVYQQAIVPGDAVTFNDSGSGTVIVNANVGPSSMVISNNTKSYTVEGTGTIVGPGGITKLGTGTALLSLTNNIYTGDTVISNGILKMGSASALSSVANLNVGLNGTLELNGQSEGVNGLFGGGIIDNNSTNNATLTVNNGGDWGGTIHDQGAGGVQLTKSGNNTLTISGTNLLNSTANPDGQVIAGLMIITNNGVVNCGSQEYWVGPTAGPVATNIVDGGTLVVNSWLVVGRGSSTANGTLIVNHGTVQKSGGGNIVVGSLGATGTLIVNGGQVFNGSDLWIGEGPTAVAALYLNGGLIQADVVRENNNGGLPTATGHVYLNGGTLQATANNANFLQNDYFEVMNGGFVLDDNGYTLSIGGSTALIPGTGSTGGLFKEGSGTVYLDTPNSYTGLTVVTNGTLAGVGSVLGSVQVMPAGNLGAGDAATNGVFAVGGNLTLQGSTTLRINETGGVITNDQVAVAGSIAYGGKLIINNITSDGTALTPGDQFQIFNEGGTGSFTSVTGPGATYSFDSSTGILTVTSVAPPPVVFTNPTGIISFTLDGANVVIQGTNGQAGATYYLLQSTNAALPLSQWVPVATNVVGANGDYTFTGTNAVTPGSVQQFYILSNTNN